MQKDHLHLSSATTKIQFTKAPFVSFKLEIIQEHVSLSLRKQGQTSWLLMWATGVRSQIIPFIWYVTRLKPPNFNRSSSGLGKRVRYSKTQRHVRWESSIYSHMLHTHTSLLDTFKILHSSHYSKEKSHRIFLEISPEYQKKQRNRHLRNSAARCMDLSLQKSWSSCSGKRKMSKHWSYILQSWWTHSTLKGSGSSIHTNLKTLRKFGNLWYLILQNKPKVECSRGGMGLCFPFSLFSLSIFDFFIIILFRSKQAL